MPAEEELKSEFGISTITLNKALTLLVTEGLVRRIPGRGTFICPFCECARETEKVAGEPIIGLVLEHIATPFGLEMLYRMDAEAARAGYKLIVRFSYGEQAREASELEYLRRLGARGVLLMPTHGRHYSQTLLKLYLEGFPLVLVDKRLRGISLPSVRTDNCTAVKELVRKLYAGGARNIAFVSAPDEEVTSVRERCTGFREAMKELGLGEAAWFWIPVGRDAKSYEQAIPPEKTFEAARVFLRGVRGRVDAVIAAEYGFVPVLVQAAHAEGMCFVRDMMLASIDGDVLSPCGSIFPYMKQDEDTIARKAVEMLLCRMRGESCAQEDHLVTALYRSAGAEAQRAALVST